MRGGHKLNRIAAALSILTTIAAVQNSNAQPVTPITNELRELASKVAGHDDGTLEANEAQLRANLVEIAANLPAPRREWWSGAAPLALKQAMNEVKATRRLKLEAVLVDKFSEDELANVLKFQDFLVQKKLQEVILSSLNAPSLQDRERMLRAAMSVGDYRRYNDFYQSDVGQKFARVTLPVYTGVAAEIEQHFTEAMKQYCGFAPAGMPECAAGRPS